MKIKNISFQITEEQEQSLWAEVLARKNRLLANSDWTQSPDVRLRNTTEWKSWREKVRTVNRHSMKRTYAKNLLEELDNQKPEIKWNDYVESVDSNDIDYIKAMYIKELHFKFKERYKEYMPFEIDLHILVEKFDQAMDFLEDNKNILNYPLIKLQHDITKKEPEEIAREFISLKEMWMIAVVRAETELYSFIGLVRDAKTVIELETIMGKL